MPDLLEWREEFPILANTVYIVYMISHSLGAMPRRTYAAMQEYAETWAERFDLPVDRHVVLRLVGEAQQAGHRRAELSIERLSLLRAGASGRSRRERSDGGFKVPLDRIVDAIDEETRLVSVSHVAFRTSTVLDLKAIVEKAHRVGAMVIADIYQSAGTARTYAS